MCYHETLYHDNEKGYIIHCLYCKHIQLGFGNIAITFCKDEFLRFQQSMARVHAGLSAAAADSPLKNITLPTPCEGINLLLSPRELNQLNHMLDMAETELRSQELIDLFKEK